MRSVKGRLRLNSCWPASQVLNHLWRKVNKCNQCDYASSQTGDFITDMTRHSAEKSNSMWLCLFEAGPPDQGTLRLDSCWPASQVFCRMLAFLREDGRTALCYISLLSGIWNIDDQHRNPNINNRDHLVGRLTRRTVTKWSMWSTILLAQALYDMMYICGYCWLKRFQRCFFL